MVRGRSRTQAVHDKEQQINGGPTSSPMNRAKKAVIIDRGNTSHIETAVEADNMSIDDEKENGQVVVPVKNGSIQRKIDEAHHPEKKRDTGPKGMCYITEESLTDWQREKIKELRQRLGEELLAETPIFNDQFSLLRWLMGWNYKIEEILPRFEKTSRILKCMKCSDLVFDNVDDLNRYCSTLTLACEYFPGGVMSLDDDGNVVTLQALGKSQPKSLSRCGRVSDVYRLCIVETSLIYQLIKVQEKKHKKKLGLRVIIDLEGFNTDHMGTSALKVYANFLRQLQYMFPDLCRRVYVINAPTMVAAAYKLIKGVLSEQSREKVVFLSSSYQETLISDIGASNLLTRWGGSFDPPHGNKQTGFLRMGGHPPESLRYAPEKNPHHVDEDKLTKLYVPARGRKEIEVGVAKPGDVVHWYFYTNGDIEFGVDQEDRLEIWPHFRLTTDWIPEFGHVECKTTGLHRVVFDNSFSMFFSKEIRYHVYIKSKD
ncbi:CRAL/TRIO domain-containing protein [Ditylenchus destructor]|uniref:CRAL/TRIO domain-containing protein n=1 Tax=Ditylenchus destructor TaxID=166010 RepID=A0AAD4N5A8_9BILA|nr:CRAL/TRIO domain-containing protein [Ditylenchus destructor]